MGRCGSHDRDSLLCRWIHLALAVPIWSVNGSLYSLIPGVDHSLLKYGAAGPYEEYHEQPRRWS